MQRGGRSLGRPHAGGGGARLIGRFRVEMRSSDDARRAARRSLEGCTTAGEKGVERLGWGAVVTKREAWAYALGKFLTDPVWFLMLFWLPKYFSTTYDVDLKVVLLPMVVMYLLSDAGSILGGWVSSKLIQPVVPTWKPPRTGS